MAEAKTNTRHKDALFKLIFGDYKENALSLYNAINGTNYTNTDDLEITTLKDALFIGIKNDLSFMINHEMCLYEQQSTFCPNMPLRGLGYFADLYKQYLGIDDEYANKLYSSCAVDIPVPKYYVFYNGQPERPDREDLFLSSLYGGGGDVEVVAHMLNVNVGHNKELMDRCKPLADMAELIHRSREYKKQGCTNEEASHKAIDSCIKDHILEDILRKERARVRNILYSGLTEEETRRMHEWELEEQTKEAREEAREEAKQDAVKRLVADGKYDVHEACEVLGVDEKVYQQHNE
jgi:hypothetical protein